MVLWENLTDPIITGREELGYPKIYGELPEPRHFNGAIHCSAGWLGHQFMSMTVREQTRLDHDEMADLAINQQGLLLYKYMPRTHDWGEHDVEYVTFTPPPELSLYLKKPGPGKGLCLFMSQRGRTSRHYSILSTRWRPCQFLRRNPQSR